MVLYHDFRDHCSVVLGEALRRDSQDYSVGLGDSREHSVAPDEALHHDFQVHSAVPDDSPRRLADLDDWLARSAVLDARRGLEDSDLRELRAVTVGPELAERRELF